ncbi:MAG: hypothetical protein ACAI43_24590 [Phycisphaerae bacterium]
MSQPEPAAAHSLTGRITALRGMVEIQPAEAAPWQPAKVGMVVPEGAAFRTGLRSAVQFVIDPDQTITLDRLGTVKLLTAYRQASGRTRTDLGMKYGRTRYDVAAGGVENESTIRSPNATLAVRGTNVSLTDSRPFPPEAVSLTGRAEFSAFKRQTVALGGRDKARVDSTHGTAAETALAQAIVDPASASSRERSEDALITDLVSRGSVVSIDRESGIRIVKGGSVPDNRALIPLLPNNLNFVLRWTGNANLDLMVSNAAESVYPSAALQNSASGGRAAFDHQGGAKGGIEIASWPATFPRQFYGIGVNHVSGPTVPANMQVFLNGKIFPLTGFDFNGLPVQNDSLDFESSPIVPGRGIEMFSPGVVDLTRVAPTARRGGTAKAERGEGKGR